MFRSRRNDVRLAGVAALCALIALPACTSGVRSGVSVKSLAADLVFGIPPLPESVPPPNIETSPEDPIGTVFRPRPAFTPPSIDEPSEPPCPEAGATDFPEQEATINPEVAPKSGTYRWVVAGQSKLQTGQVISLDGFVTRMIVDVAISSASRFSFTTVENELVPGSDTEVRQTYNVVVDDGIFLARVDRRRGSQRSVFEPFPAIEILPLPVRIGLDINQTGVDPNSLQALEHKGTVASRLRIDACGRVIDSWFVDGERTFTNNRGQRTTSNYDYSVATQLGGFIVFEKVVSPSVNPTLQFEARLGQVEPDPETG